MRNSPKVLFSKFPRVPTAHTIPVTAQTDVDQPIAETPTDSALKQQLVPSLPLDTVSEREPVGLANANAPSENRHDPIAERLKLVEQRFAGV